MVRIHFVDGNFLDIHTIGYEDLIDKLNRLINAKFINFNDTTIVINNITYIERIMVEA